MRGEEGIFKHHEADLSNLNIKIR